MVPVKRLFSNSTTVRSNELEKISIILPVSEFWFNLSRDNEVSRDKLVGMVPVRRLTPSARYCSNDRSPRPSGSEPVK